MDWKLEVVVIPVSDIDRAKSFYADRVGFHLDIDHSAGADFRLVQLTPPGSACSVTLMKNAAAGTLQGMHLIVSDIDVARVELTERGVQVSDLFHFQQGGQQPGADPERADYGTFLTFNDPDGNGWMIQEVPSRGKT